MIVIIVIVIMIITIVTMIALIITLSNTRLEPRRAPGTSPVASQCTCPGGIRPISQLTLWVSEGLTQA